MAVQKSKSSRCHIPSSGAKVPDLGEVYSTTRNEARMTIGVEGVPSRTAMSTLFLDLPALMAAVVGLVASAP